MTFEEMLQRYAKENRGIVCEPPAYLLEKQQGEYTVEDLQHLPEDFRVELIDGVMIRMESPISIHQRVSLRMAMLLEQFIDDHNGACTTYIAPFDVQLKADDPKTVLQPDVLVVCDESKDTGKRIVGAPDLVIEILSPTTKSKDTGVKKRKYKEAGVREYWIIDLIARRITVCEFSINKTTLYGFDEKIPVGIFGGRCAIDVKRAVF